MIVEESRGSDCTVQTSLNFQNYSEDCSLLGVWRRGTDNC